MPNTKNHQTQSDAKPIRFIPLNLFKTRENEETELDENNKEIDCFYEIKIKDENNVDLECNVVNTNLELNKNALSPSLSSLNSSSTSSILSAYSWSSNSSSDTATTVTPIEIKNTYPSNLKVEYVPRGRIITVNVSMMW